MSSISATAAATGTNTAPAYPLLNGEAAQELPIPGPQALPPLNAQVLLRPDSASHESASTTYCVLSWVARIAVLVVTVALMVFVGMSAPGYLPFASIGAFLLSQCVLAPVLHNLDLASKNEANLAEYDKAWEQVLAEVPEDLDDLKDYLRIVCGISNISAPNGIYLETLSELRHLIAKYVLLTKQVEERDATKLEILDTPIPEEIQNDPALRQACITRRQFEAMLVDNQCVGLKMQAAYIRSLLMQPYRQEANSGEIFKTVAPPTPHTLAEIQAAPALNNFMVRLAIHEGIRREFGEAPAPYLIFTDAERGSFPYNNIKEASIEELTGTLFPELAELDQVDDAGGDID